MPQSVMCIHAHPDDEALFTGGLLAKTKSEGGRSAVITCTDGRWGYSPGHIEVGHEDHDPESTARQRLADLRKSAEILGVERLVPLQYFDSGMRGWPVNAWPQAFVNQDLKVVAAQLAAEVDRFKPDLVVTYDRFGVYGHPDHVKAHEATVAALEMTSHHPQLLLATVSKKAAASMMASLHGSEGELPQWLLDMGEFGTPDEDIVEVLKVGEHLAKKRAAIAAHGSQLDNHFFLDMDDASFERMLGTERYAEG
ncbi:MAG: PIG-L family deacetylase [Actinomycetota bacterium]